MDKYVEKMGALGQENRSGGQGRNNYDTMS